MGGLSMKRFLSLSLGLILATSASVVLASSSSNSVDGDYSDYNIAVSGENVVLTSSSSSLNYKATTGTDTFCLYGGPGSIDGKFEDANHVVPDRQGWFGIDLTDLPVFWQHSQFNTANLNNHGAGNWGMWCGQDGTTQPSIGWENTPGYGNGWFAILRYNSGTIANTAAGQTVALDFVFNHDTEPGYDYFLVQYDSAGAFTTVFSADGSNRDTANIFQVPGVQYAVAAGVTPIVYTGGDYGGDASDEVVVRMVVSSDGAWSDEDGLWPTQGGAATVDDISIDHADNGVGGELETFEGAAPFLWSPAQSPWVGDFSKVFARMGDDDPCTEDITPLMTFLDDDTPPSNSPGLNGLVSTGGESSPSGSYGVPGSWVVNFNGGLTLGELSLSNEAWSPEIDWDTDSGVVDASDDADVAGAFIRFSVWQDLPLGNGIFYVWHVRSTLDGFAWTGMQDRNFVYYGGGVALWANRQPDVSDLLNVSPLKVQMGLGVTDLASAFSFPGNDATPSPAFDNAGFFKYRVAGPTFATRAIDLFQDGFPAVGTIDVVGDPGSLDIPMDMARDINATAFGNNPGDSIIVDVTNVIPGATVDSLNIRMFWHLERNPVFDAFRTMPARAQDQNTAAGASSWTGEVVAQQSFTSGGGSIDGRWYFDLPDADFLYPGDLLNYYIQATDDGARTTTLPGNITGFGTTAYSRTYTVRGLPTLDVAGNQPDVLFWNDFGRRGGENDYMSAFGQLGMVEGVDFDTYTTMGPSSGVSNGLGSAGFHGANVNQIANYHCLLYTAGNLSSTLLSDGTQGTADDDKANDVGLLEAWHALGGGRYAAYFGDHIASGNAASATTAAYVTTVMAVQLLDDDVRDDIQFQTAPEVHPVDAAFTQDYIAYGGCLAINQFDAIDALSGTSTVGHRFGDGSGGLDLDAAASVIHDRGVAPNRIVDVTFPYGMIYVRNNVNTSTGPVSARTTLLGELFAFFGGHSNSGSATDAPSLSRKVSLSAYPNPFNPSTTIKMAMPFKGDASVKLYNLRGQLVTTLHAGELGIGTHEFVWTGLDSNGATVASGVYMVEAVGAGQRVIQKIALVK